MQTIIFFFSASAACWIILENSRISRREKTIEIVQASLNEDRGEGCYARYSAAIDEIDENKLDLAEISDPSTYPQYAHLYERLIAQLNYYELVALGIKKRVFDEEFYREWFKAQVLEDYQRLKPFIKALRHRRGRAFLTEYRWLVRKWLKRQHPEVNPGRLWMTWYMLTGKDARVHGLLQDQLRLKPHSADNDQS